MKEVIEDIEKYFVQFDFGIGEIGIPQFYEEEIFKIHSVSLGLRGA